MASGWINQVFPPKPEWGFDDIPDLSGKVMLVTGGNTGIGKETVKQLLLHNAKVYLAARSEEKALKAISDLHAETGKEAAFLKLDLADLKSMKASAEDFTSKETQLHTLFNSAGVMWPPIDDLTADGYDLQFGTNVLGQFYFTKLLLPCLISTAKSSPRWGRVVNTSSIGHMLFNRKDLNFESFKEYPARKRMGTKQLYYQSKFGNIVYALELHKRYADQGIVSVSLHPGSIPTELTRHTPYVQRVLLGIFKSPAWMGALTQLWAGTSPEGADMGGKYLTVWARYGVPNPETQDAEAGRKLWEWLEDQVKDL